VYTSDDVIVTYVEESQIERTIRVDGEIILEPGSPAVWFTFPELAHDIGRFHRADGSFTGIYANVLTPVQFLNPLEWQTTDLFLDIWFGATAHGPTVLDEDELLEALSHDWISAEQAEDARGEVARIIGTYAAGEWPPPVVREWPLERARAIVSA
jgi:predicted RNA-binding protein associated with RNAse of E/G family